MSLDIEGAQRVNPDTCIEFRAHVGRVLFTWKKGEGELPESPSGSRYVGRSAYDSCVDFVQHAIGEKELDLNVYPRTIPTMRSMGYEIVLDGTIQKDDILAYGKFEQSEDPLVREEGYPFQGLDFHSCHLSVIQEHGPISAFGSLQRRVMFDYEHEIDAVPFTQEYVTHVLTFRKMQANIEQLAS